MSQNFYFSHFLFSCGDFDVKKSEKATGEFSTPRTEDLDLRTVHCYAYSGHYAKS